MNFFPFTTSAPPSAAKMAKSVRTEPLKRILVQYFSFLVHFCDRRSTKMAVSAQTISAPTFCGITRPKKSAGVPVGAREIAGKMARLGSRGSSAGHTSESACAASLAALAGADFSQGSGDDSGANRRPGISGHTLREHFHLPLHTVALKFGMCTTAFKKMCRRMGIAKWPHRQVWLIRPPPMRGASWVRRSTESSRRPSFSLRDRVHKCGPLRGLSGVHSSFALIECRAPALGCPRASALLLLL